MAERDRTPDVWRNGEIEGMKKKIMSATVVVGGALDSRNKRDGNNSQTKVR